MAEVRILQDGGKDIIPVTHEDAVLDSNGVKISDKYAKKEDLKNIDLSEINNAIEDLNDKYDKLFQSASNGKQLIADAIGNSLITGDSTFSAMSEAILGLKRNSENETDAKEVLYNMMIEDGYNEATSSMTVDELIELLDGSNIDINDVKQIACGGHHVVILKNDGSIWSCGNNEDGQLGLGDTNNRTTFTQVTTNINNDVKQIACSGYYTFILKNDGSVWSCGFNGYGQLGLNNTTSQNTFTKVTTNINNDVKEVICGNNHSFILKNDGSIWACGRNNRGQLGLDNTTDRTKFTKVSTNINNDVKQVDCGNNYTFILKNDGSVWACGTNNYGELGLGDTINYKYTFTKVSTNINNDVRHIACSNVHTFILKNDGSVWSCGSNGYGQLGFGNDIGVNTFTKVTTNINNDVKQIACGNNHTFILKTDGSVWACGNNDNGRLGLGDNNIHSTFTKVTTNINNDVKEVICGDGHTFILKNNGSVLSCGANDDGQLGLGDTINKTTFTQVPLSSQSIDEYEINRQKLYYYLLDNDISATESMDIGTMLDLLVDDYVNNMILDYENNLRIILIDAGVDVTEEDDMVSLITKVDEEFTKDSNTINDLNTSIENTRSTLASLMQEGGYDITDNEDIDSLLELLALSGLNISEIRQIACSQSHTVILKNDGSVWTCGYNINGQLGLGTSDTNAHNVFTQATTNINNDVKQIACGYYHTVILKNDGSVWGCGNAQYGQLGLGNFNNQTSFTQATTNINNDVKQIACGYNHTFILKTDGSLWACGNNEYGQLGLGDTNEYCTSFTQVTTNINNDVKQIACGQYHTFILKNDGSIWACGNAKYGQLGLGNYNNQTTFTKVTTNINNDVKRIACGYNHTFISKNDGSIWSCGLNSKGQLGLNDTTSSRTTFTQVTTNINNDVKQLVCGDAFTFILKNDGSLWTCGYNYRGQLGLGTSGTNEYCTLFTKVTTNINNDVKRIACGYYHTVISKNDGSVWACGYNNRGQLGLNDTTNRTTFTQVTSEF